MLQEPRRETWIPAAGSGGQLVEQRYVLTLIPSLLLSEVGSIQAQAVWPLCDRPREHWFGGSVT